MVETVVAPFCFCLANFSTMGGGDAGRDLFYEAGLFIDKGLKFYKILI